jgi:hypothetical protein
MPFLRPALGALAIVVLGGGCGGDAPSWSASFDLAPGETRISVTAWRGTVRLRSSTTGRVEVTLRGEAPVPLDTVFAMKRPKETPSLIRLFIHESAKDADLELEIAVPPGTIHLSCACADADVAVSGEWARLEVKTTGGGIVARLDGAGAGSLESQSGAVLYSAAKGPTGELTVKSIRGDVTVRLPAAWNGQVHAATQTGKLDVPPHRNLRTIWDENEKGVIGHVGPQHRKGEPLATVWGTSSTGNVSLRLEE